MRRYNLVIATAIFFSLHFTTPFAVDFSAGGYVKNMQTASFVNHHDNWIIANIWNARVNVRSFITDDITWVFGGNTLFSYSNHIAIFANNRNGWYHTSGPRDFSVGYVAQFYAVGGFFDRNFIEYQRANWVLSAGVQRINWGMNLIWNPNDIFNAYSIYDFDYQERPGILSARGRYYVSETSTVDVVATSANIFGALYRVSINQHDLQLIAAIDDNDIIGAAGFAADVFDAGLRGEATLFYDYANNATNHIAALTADYAFTNGFYVHLGALYNSFGVVENALLHRMTPNHDSPVKNLAAGRYSTFFQISYPFTPLLSGSAIAIMNLSDYSIYFSPIGTYSISDNLEILLASQLNFGDENEEFSEDFGRSFFARLRWSF